MITIGVTGGIGSGKSTVCRMLADRGARVFDADLEARRLMTTDFHLKRSIRDTFGDQAYRDDGSLNRVFLAERIFSDDEARQAMNAIVHPAVRRAFEEAVRNAKREGEEVLVREAAILPREEEVDLLLVVSAPEQDRINRVVSRDDTDDIAVRARMKAQADEREFRRRADVWIDNDGSMDDLESKVDAFWKRHVEAAP